MQEGTESNSSFIKLKIESPGFGKPSQLFEEIRRKWYRKVNKYGNPDWLESCETVAKTFEIYKDRPFQSLQLSKFSLGNFQDRGTYVEHWISDKNPSWISDGLSADFESDTQTLVLSFDDSRYLEGQRGFRLEFEYRQFDNYVLVDENPVKNEIGIYFPLQWPPKVFQGNSNYLVL